MYLIQVEIGQEVYIIDTKKQQITPTIVNEINKHTIHVEYDNMMFKKKSLRVHSIQHHILPHIKLALYPEVAENYKNDYFLEDDVDSYMAEITQCIDAKIAQIEKDHDININGLKYKFIKVELYRLFLGE